MNKIKRNKSIKLLKKSSITGYLTLTVSIMYFTYYICATVLNFKQTILTNEWVFILTVTSLFIISFVFGFIIPITIHESINKYKRILHDKRDSNRLVTAIFYIKKGDLTKAMDISNTIKSSKRKTFLLGLITGITFNSQYEDQREMGLNELNKFKYK